MATLRKARSASCSFGKAKIPKSHQRGTLIARSHIRENLYCSSSAIDEPRGALSNTSYRVLKKIWPVRFERGTYALGMLRDYCASMASGISCFRVRKRGSCNAGASTPHMKLPLPPIKGALETELVRWPLNRGRYLAAGIEPGNPVSRPAT